jgi:hypothetical protein
LRRARSHTTERRRNALGQRSFIRPHRKHPLPKHPSSPFPTPPFLENSSPRAQPSGRHTCPLLRGAGSPRPKRPRQINP